MITLFPECGYELCHDSPGDLRFSRAKIVERLAMAGRYGQGVTRG